MELISFLADTSGNFSFFHCPNIFYHALFFLLKNLLCCLNIFQRILGITQMNFRDRLSKPVGKDSGKLLFP